LWPSGLVSDVQYQATHIQPLLNGGEKPCWLPFREYAILHGMMLLTANAGSSSLRLAAFSAAGADIEAIAATRFDLHDGSVEPLLRHFVNEHKLNGVTAVVHRIVHGGAHFSGACKVDRETERKLTELAPLAPLHSEQSLALIRTARAVFGADTPQVASFDTAFYRNLPQIASHYALPAGTGGSPRLAALRLPWARS
jgi:acetate kinase